MARAFRALLGGLFAFAGPSFAWADGSFEEQVKAVRKPSLALSSERRPMAAAGPADPLSLMELIYTTEDPERLRGLVLSSRELLLRDKGRFLEVLRGLRNDGVDLARMTRQAELSPDDRIKLALRTLARSLERLGAVDGGGAVLADVAPGVVELFPLDWRVVSYLGPPLYNAMARKAPELLAGMTAANPGKPGEIQALLALARAGRAVDQSRIRSILSGSRPDAVPLYFYLDDQAAKLALLAQSLDRIAGQPYDDRCWLERELVNVLASFPAGLEKLRELRSRRRLSFLSFRGILFGSLAGSGVPEELLAKHGTTLEGTAGYIVEANRRFGGAERIAYVDITPDIVLGRDANPAGWGANGLFMASRLLSESPQAIAAIMLHEACERKYEQGVFSARLGRSYIRALRDGSVESLRLGRRIGGAYADPAKGIGHPQDSEREWLAESASAAILGQNPPGTEDAVGSAEELLRP